MSKSPLHDEHVGLGARFTTFGGWDMPLQYAGIMAEHRAVREAAGLFDISHMGQVRVWGPDAGGFLDYLLTNDIARLKPGWGCYALMCREDGCVIADLYVFRVGGEHFQLVVNASRTEVDLQWMRDRLNGMVELIPESGSGGLAVQGPKAEEITCELMPGAAGLGRNETRKLELEEGSVAVSRTGYTGEDGFEIFGPVESIRHYFRGLLKAGKGRGLLPCGLGARDTLRLEMGYRLYGNDMDEEHTALEAGLGWVVKFGKGDFLGKDMLLKEKEGGSRRRLIGFRLRQPGVARRGHRLLQSGVPIGEVTSGTFSPSLRVGIGFAYVDSRALPASKLSSYELTAEVHGREIPVEIVKPPFYSPNRLTHRKAGRL